MNNQIKTYSFKEADELFGIQYKVKETGKIENFPDELLLVIGQRFILLRSH